MRILQGDKWYVRTIISYRRRFKELVQMKKILDVWNDVVEKVNDGSNEK